MEETVTTFETHLTAVMDSLIRASVCEITKLFQETVNDYIVELTLNRKENDTLKLRLRLTENKLRNERKYGMGWAASRRGGGGGAAATEDGASGRKKRKRDAPRGKQKQGSAAAYGKGWPGGLWEEGGGGAVAGGGGDGGEGEVVVGGGKEAREMYLIQFPGDEEEEEEADGGLPVEDEEGEGTLCREGEEMGNIKEEEALKMDPPHQNLQAGSRSHSEGEQSDPPPALHPGEKGDEEDEEEWEMGSTEPSEGGMSIDELRGLETALRAERGRERALRACNSISPAADMAPVAEGPLAPKYIGLDGLEQEGELDPQPPTLEREDLTAGHGRTREGLRSGGSSGGGGQPRWAKRLREAELAEPLAAEGLAEPGGDGAEDLPYLSAPGSVGDSVGEDEEGAGDLLHFCTQCGGGFPSGAELEEHPCPLGSAHLQGGEPAATPFPCASCGNAFSHAWALKNHECACAAERPHCCELCGKRFTHTRSLERHQLVHTGERPHRCPQCGRSFSRLGNLERHQRIHTGERPYGCEACGKRFSRVEYLKRHQQIHSGDKASALQCTQCGLTFGDMEQLKNHQCY
ncbi:Zinc finger and SCAN domain-containing protein 22 [Merluccius polli]|uniref:Zinc finger and SCAN domain-containing protein 22 n=1 Tax=Merluccius polli TaxID=89951 RepID=A0AA47N0P4_MERPO|nr:Zinc finger and SCAN domain-containing protein 22 [Merluccius polli]